MKLIDDYCKAERLSVPSVLPGRDSAFRGLVWNGNLQLAAAYDFVRLVKLEKLDFGLQESDAVSSVCQRAMTDTTDGSHVLVVTPEQMAAYLRGLYGSAAGFQKGSGAL